MTDRFDYQREQAEIMLDRMQAAGMPARSPAVDGRYPASSWQLSGAQLFRCSTEPEEALHVMPAGMFRIEWVLYADVFQEVDTDYVKRPAGWTPRACYRLEGMSGYQHVNWIGLPLPLDVYPGDLDTALSHLVNTARASIADGVRLGLQAKTQRRAHTS